MCAPKSALTFKGMNFTLIQDLGRSPVVSDIKTLACNSCKVQGDASWMDLLWVFLFTCFPNFIPNIPCRYLIKIHESEVLLFNHT